MITTKLNTPVKIKDAKKLFRTLGGCSNTLFYILNREFGHQKEAEVKAAEPLAGGLMRQGHQCGMLWGSSLAVGSEAYRRFNDPGQATAVAITTTQQIMKSFSNRTQAINCIDVTHCDWTNKWSVTKYMLTGKFLSCFTLIDAFAPESIQTAYEGLNEAKAVPPQPAMSCASELVRLMGGSKEEQMTVAGFAGGLGLSGHGCGALAAAIWLKSVNYIRNNPGKGNVYDNPDAQNTYDNFIAATDYKMLCSEITGREFKSVDEHMEYVKSGGCSKLMEALAG